MIHIRFIFILFSFISVAFAQGLESKIVNPNINCLDHALNLNEHIEVNTDGWYVRGTPKEWILQNLISQLNQMFGDDFCKIFTGETEGHYPIALFISPPARGVAKDFHFLRKNEDGSWSHKLGFAGKITQLDANEKIISNPETAYLKYHDAVYHFVGYILIKHRHALTHL